MGIQVIIITQKVFAKFGLVFGFSGFPPTRVGPSPVTVAVADYATYIELPRLDYFGYPRRRAHCVRNEQCGAIQLHIAGQHQARTRARGKREVWLSIRDGGNTTMSFANCTFQNNTSLSPCHIIAVRLD
jgi:hypothetical protein